MHFPFSYEIIYSRRKTVAIQITRNGKVRIRAPYGCPRSFIDSFIRSKEDWVVKHLEKARSHPSPSRPPLSEEKRETLRGDRPGRIHAEDGILRPVSWA